MKYSYETLHKLLLRMQSLDYPGYKDATELDISAHASLGLRGNQLLSQNYEVVEGWYLVHKEDAGNCEKLITTTRSNLGWKLLSPSIRNEVIWLNNNVFENK